MSEEYKMPPAQAVETLVAELARAVCTLLKLAQTDADAEAAKQLQAHLDNIHHFAAQSPAGLQWRLEKASS